MIAFAVGVAAAAVGGATPPLLELVRRGEAGAAYVQLATDLDLGRTTLARPEPALVADLLRHLRCESLGPPAAVAAEPYRLARELLDVERERVERLRREHRPTGPDAWIADGRLRWKTPPSTADAGAIRWPAEEERWSDETALFAAPELRCPQAPSQPSPPSPPSSAGARAGAGEPATVDEAAASVKEKALLTHEAETMRALRLRLPPGVPVRVAAILDEEVLRARLGDWPEVWVLARLLDEESARAGAGPLAAREQAEASILGALAAEHDQQDAEALARWERAATLPLSTEERLFVDLHRQRWLVSLGHLDQARAVLDRWAELPSPVGDYLRYRMALVRFRAGDEAGLLAIARAVLARRSAAEVAADPVRRGVEELALLQIARHPFTPEQVEVIESLGLVREVYLRLEALGAVALDRGRPLLAVDIYRWLLEHYRLPYARPTYLGRLAAAAAAQGDDAVFASSFGALVDETLAQIPRPPSATATMTGKGPSAPPTPRRTTHARRSIEWDRQILLATRDSVAALVARHDVTALRLLTDKLQLYLRTVGARQTYAELSALYRMASSQLPPSPRAYAEKVGAERSPVWLGEVTLDRVTVVVPEPELALGPLEGPVTLLCLPDGGACPRWLGPPPPPPTTKGKPTVAHPRVEGAHDAR